MIRDIIDSAAEIVALSLFVATILVWGAIIAERMP